MCITHYSCHDPKEFEAFECNDYPYCFLGLLPHTPLHFPESRRQGARERATETEMRSLVNGLLQPVVSQRLGAGTSGPSDIKSHPFFKQVNWSLT